MRHRDSAGHQGLLRSGGVQWMTAGSGIEHSEMPEQEEGLMSGYQLWVNLPASKKMNPPRYQEFEPDEIPMEELGDGTVIRVIAGTTANGTTGPVTEIAAQPLYIDVTLPPGGSFHQPIHPGHNAFVKMIDGRLAVDHEELVTGSLAVLGEGDQLEANAREEGARFLLIAGRPFNEPVARSGPFVMNSDEEIRQAYSDYRDGKFGRVE
jgi:redox-sensitive bicupin YhaK (pirin superfamily)